MAARSMRDLVGWRALAGWLVVSACGVAQVEATAADSESVESPEAEVQFLIREIQLGRRALQELRSADCILGRFNRIDERLSVFDQRFGIPCRGVAGWTRLEGLARECLELFDARHSAESVQGDSNLMLVRHTLLGLTGGLDEADTLLNGFKVRHSCGTCAAPRRAAVRQRQAAWHAREGRLTAAIDALAGTQREPGLDEYGEGKDILRARHGLLLLEQRRVHEGVQVLQRVVDLCPETIGARLARRALHERGRLIEPTLARVVETYDMAGTRRGTCVAQHAVIRHGFPDSMDWALARLEAGDACWREHYLDAFADLGDERARPLFLAELADPMDLRRLTSSARGLLRLGDPSGVDGLLGWLIDRDQVSEWELQRVHEILLELHGDGPAICAWGLARPFAQTWIDWRAGASGASLGCPPARSLSGRTIAVAEDGTTWVDLGSEQGLAAGVELLVIDSPLPWEWHETGGAADPRKVQPVVVLAVEPHRSRIRYKYGHERRQPIPAGLTVTTGG